MNFYNKKPVLENNLMYISGSSPQADSKICSSFFGVGDFEHYSLMVECATEILQRTLSSRTQAFTGISPEMNNNQRMIDLEDREKNLRFSGYIDNPLYQFDCSTKHE